MESSTTKEYFKQAGSWYTDKYLSQQVWSRRWKWAFVGQTVVAGLLAIGIVLMAPLKTMVPFPILVNDNNQVIKVLHPKSDVLPMNEAMVQNDVVRYIRNREGFNAHTLNYQFKQVAYSTSKNIFEDFEQAQSPSNPDSPLNTLGLDGIRDIKIHDVIFLDSSHATGEHHFKNLPSNVVQVDFSSENKKEGVESTEHWVATISFDYEGMPENELRAWENWNGFVVTSYRINQRQV